MKKAKEVSKFMRKTRRLMDEQHLKAADLAFRTRFTPSRFSKWFDGQGTPSVYQALAIARALKVPLEWLADDDAPAEPPRELDEGDRMILEVTRAIGVELALKLLTAPIRREANRIELGEEDREQGGEGKGGREGGPRKRNHAG